MIDITGIGELLAKFDTGNSVHSCSLDAQNIQVKGNIVHWETMGKKYKGRIIDKIKIKSNVSPDHDVLDRVVVEKDVFFDGNHYPNIPFNLVDRGHKNSKVLINREFMMMAGLIVNPNKKFLLSIDPEENK
jgi:hypothetical protein